MKNVRVLSITLIFERFPSRFPVTSCISCEQCSWVRWENDGDIENRCSVEIYPIETTSSSSWAVLWGSSWGTCLNHSSKKYESKIVGRKEKMEMKPQSFLSIPKTKIETKPKPIVFYPKLLNWVQKILCYILQKVLNI